MQCEAHHSVKPSQCAGRCFRRLLLVGLLCSGAFVTPPASAADVDFRKDILPLFQQHCSDCHSSDNAESGLNLETALQAFIGGDSGEKLIVPGSSQQSYLIERVTSDDADKRMPPDADALPAEQIKLLKSWIDNADSWKAIAAEAANQSVDHWSFQPVVRPDIPHADTTRNPIDAFIQARQSEVGLSMSAPASRRRLLRRLSLVMHGLPPSPEQLQQFLDDDRPDAWNRWVDQFLASPRYGERWATFWLDLVRFGETHGFETNRERPNAWHYRDWVINAFNSDKPYNDFVMEQIAGDALGADVGTGFLVAGPYDLVKGQDPDLRLMQRQDELADMINTTGTAFLGLTLGCARCHNHKFDPVSQTDYYSMQAVFAGVNHADRALAISEDTQQQLSHLDGQIATLRNQLTKFIRRPGYAHLLIDDSDTSTGPAVGIEYLTTPAGTGKNPTGSKRGFADDVGTEDRSANVSRGEYTWWKSEPEKDVAVYRPLSSGRYRIWLSWGCGWNSHTTDARYFLDIDGRLDTTADRMMLAEVNQQLFADGSGMVPGQSLWSGFYDAGVHELEAAHTIVLQCGTTGSAITADALLLEPVSEDADPVADKVASPVIRAAVNARMNEDVFPSVEARFVRFTINATNASQPCIDELEVFCGDNNVALASSGATAASSGDFVHPLHKLEHINDGRYGNARSWISEQQSGGWVQIEFAEPAAIDRIVWGRDREGQYQDRLATDYRIDVSLDGQVWQTVATSHDRLPPGSSEPPSVAYDFDGFSPAEATAGKALLADFEKLTAKREQLAKPALVYAGTFSQPGPTFRLYRGEPGSPREEVVPAAIHSLTDLTLPKDLPEQQRRLAIAEWIASPQNPLTARVIVNRLWQQHFGTGIVDTPSDMGRNGTPPSHPDLLNWLAAELMDNGWSIKHIQRLILTSDTWQQDSRPHPESVAVDAGSRLLWRFPPRRMSAEGIRDSMLAVTGKLNLTMGGPGFSAFEVEPENVRHYFPRKTFGPDEWRRMVYMTRVRQERDAVFGVFDCPDFSQVVPKRSRSTTPLQALNLMNSGFVLQQSEFLAERLAAECETPEQQVALAWKLCYGRPPHPEEIRAALDFVAATGWHQLTRAMLNSNEFVFIN